MMVKKTLMVLLEEEEVEAYIINTKQGIAPNHKLEKCIKCVVVEIKTRQFGAPFKNKHEAYESIDLAFTWYMDHMSD